MIIKKVTESLEDIHKEFEKHYASNFDSEEQFLEVVKLDPSSYPKTGSEYNMNVDPIKVGSLASGGNSGLLIRCWNKGEKDFLNYKEDVIKACLTFLNNRGSFTIKNAGQFESVRDFVDYVLHGKELNNVKEFEKSKGKNVSIEDKYNTYYKNIPHNDFLELINLDPETNVESNKLGDFAQQVLLRLFTEDMLKDLKNNKFRYNVQKFMQFYYSKLIKLSVKNLNQYESWEQVKKEILEIIDPAQNVNFSRTSLWPFKVIQSDPKLVEGKDYNVIGITKEYTILQFLTYRASHHFDWPYFEGPYENIPSSNRTINWCTGYGSSYLDSYGNPKDNVMYSFIPNDVSYRTEPKAYMQISITIANPQQFRGALDGNDQSSSNFWKNAGNDFKSQIENKNSSDGWNDFAFDFFIKYPTLLPFVVKNNTWKQNYTIQQAMKFTTAAQRNNNDISEPQTYTYESSVDFKVWLSSNTIGDLAELVIGENVTEIPDYIFEGASHLLKVTFAKTNNLKRIGIRAFSGCSSLTKIEIPDGVEEIGLGAFSDCVNLSGSIRLPLSIKRLYPYCFKNHNKKGIRFSLPEQFAEQGKKLIIPNKNDNYSSEEEVNWWHAANRFTFRNN